MSGHALDILFNDNLEADVEHVNRINKMLERMTDEQANNLNLRRIELLTIQPSTDLRQIAANFEASTGFRSLVVVKTLATSCIKPHAR